MVMSLLIIRYENKVSRKHISALIKPRWTSESEMEWLLMAPIFAKLPFCGLLLQGRDCPRLSHFRSCKLPKRDQYKLTYKAQQDGGEAVRLFLVPTDRPTFYFKASHCQPAAHLWFFFFLLHTDLLCIHNISLHATDLYFCPGCNYHQTDISVLLLQANEGPGKCQTGSHWWFPAQLQMPRGALRVEGQGAVLEGRALPPNPSLSCGNGPSGISPGGDCIPNIAFNISHEFHQAFLNLFILLAPVNPCANALTAFHYFFFSFFFVQEQNIYASNTTNESGVLVLLFICSQFLSH